MDELVSITIPSFNQKIYLNDCIESAISQTYKNIEIIIYDDASTDGSQDVILSYQKKYPGKIKFISSSQNYGLTNTRHSCQIQSFGKYIAWLDADDISEPNRIEEQVDFLKSNTNCSLCYSNMKIIRGFSQTEELVYGKNRVPRSGNYIDLLKYENFIISSSIMYSVDKTKYRGYHFPFGKTKSDWHFLIRVTRQHHFGYIDKPLGFYRRHPFAATANAQHVTSGVRQRRGQALEAMLQEFSDEKKLLNYCLSRYYLSQLLGARKQMEYKILMQSLMKLLARPQSTFFATLDRFQRKNILPQID